MADDNVDFRFLGQQVKNLQGDVRDMRGDHHRLEGNVAGMRSDITRLDGRMDGVEQRLDRVEQRLDRVEQRLDRVEQRLDRVEIRLDQLDQKIDNHHRANQAQFDQHAQTATTNLQLVLTAISGLQAEMRSSVEKLDAKIDTIKHHG